VATLRPLVQAVALGIDARPRWLRGYACRLEVVARP